MFVETLLNLVNLDLAQHVLALAAVVVGGLGQIDKLTEPKGCSIAHAADHCDQVLNFVEPEPDGIELGQQRLYIPVGFVQFAFKLSPQSPFTIPKLVS